MFSSLFLLSALTLVGANPLLVRQLQEGPNCALNAMGTGVSIQLNDSVLHPFFELGVPFVEAGVTLRAVSTVHGWEQPDFHLQQNGQAKPSYIVK